MNLKRQLDLLRRGAVEIISEEELAAKLERAQRTGKPLNIKLGLDPTAPDIHLGISVVLRKLRQFQDLGHQVIIIIGDFTAAIGDPSQKSVTRPMLSPEEIARNARTYQEQYSQILDPAKTKVVFNSQWLAPLNLANLVHLASKLTVARVLERDDFSERLREQKPLGLHELLYPLCQAYDSVMVEADVELGGADQKFNNLMGRDLQRALGQEPQVVLLMPLLVGTDGVQKMSKSLGNYIGISEPPQEKFGKVMSIPDELIVPYFTLCTDVPLEEIRRLEAEMQSGHLNPAVCKRRLAREIVTIFDGSQAALQAEKHFDALFVHRDAASLEAANLPVISLDRSLVENDQVWVVNLLTGTGLAASRGEARRLIRQKAVEWQGKPVEDEMQRLPFKPNSILRVGRRALRVA